MTPDLIFVGEDGVFDATAVGWSPTRDVHPLAGLCGPALQAPAHAPGCCFEPWPDLAFICFCQNR